MSKIWTPEFLHEVTALYRAGMGPTEIGLKFGLTRVTVTAKLQREGIADPKRSRRVTPPPPKPNGPWSKERTLRLRELWAEGVPSTTIAERLNQLPGPTVTKHAVVSKRDRLGLPQRSSDVQQINARVARGLRSPNVGRDPHAGSGLNMRGAKSGGPPAVVFGPVSLAPKKPFHGKADAFLPLPGAEPVPFLERTGRQCRWPVGGDGHELMCCGGHAETGHYCRPHAAIAYQAVPARKPSANDLMRSLRRHVS